MRTSDIVGPDLAPDTRSARRTSAKPWRSSVSRLVGIAFVILMLAFIIAPIAVVVLSSFTAGDYITFPPRGLSLKYYAAALRDPRFVGAFVTSILASVFSATIALALGTAAGVGLTRLQFRGRNTIASLLMSPLMIPTLITGITLLQFYALLRVQPSLWTTIGGHLVITLPYAVRLVMGALLGFDQRIERAAMTLGASPLKAFFTITLPNISAGLFGALAFAGIMSFDDIGIALFISPAQRPTLPVAIFAYLDQNYDPLVLAVSSFMILVSIVVILMLERLVGISHIVANAQAG